MKTTSHILWMLPLLLLLIQPSSAQQMKLGQALVISAIDPGAGVDADVFEAHVSQEVASVWRMQAPDVDLHLFRGDRGREDRQYRLVWSADSHDALATYVPDDADVPVSQELLSSLGPTVDERGVVANLGPFTEYVLVGGDDITVDLPSVEILGIHYIQVKPGMEAAFEAFVRDRLHPALVGDAIPGMDLIYYKGIRGEGAGSYITIYAIDTVERRESYWPAGQPETDPLKEAFKPLDPLALELRPFLVEGSFPDVDSGLAAAIYESRVWSDFVTVEALAR